MLPAPKRKLPASASGKSTLGGGSGDKKSSLSVNAASSQLSSKPHSTDPLATGVENEEDEQDSDAPKAGPSSLLPASMARKAAKAGAAKKQEEELDLFGLGEPTFT